MERKDTRTIGRKWEMNIEIGKIHVSHIESKYQLVGEGKISFQGWGGGGQCKAFETKNKPQFRYKFNDNVHIRIYNPETNPPSPRYQICNSNV